MRQLGLVVLAVLIAWPAAAEDFVKEQQLCGKHLRPQLRRPQPIPQTAPASRYEDAFAAACDAIDAREIAIGQAARAARAAADLDALKALQQGQ